MTWPNVRAESADSTTASPRWATAFYRNPYLLWLGIAVVFVAGFASLSTLPRLEDPRIVNRAPLILTPVPGASAERVEALVTKPLEDALDEIDTIKTLETTSRPGISVVNVELDDTITESQNDSIFAEIRDKVGEATRELPPDALTPEVDDKRDPVAFTLILGVTYDGTEHGSGVAQSPGGAPAGLLTRLGEALADRLRNVSGTELVRVYGAVDEELTVTVARDELAEMGLDAAGLAERIGAADSRQPAGTIRGTRGDLRLEVDGEFETVRRVAAVPVVAGGMGSTLTVGDVADVERGWSDPVDTLGLVDGRRSVLVAARVSPEVRVDQWIPLARAAVDVFAAQRGPGVRIDRVFDQAAYTTERLTELTNNLLAGAAVIVATVLIIMGFRPAVIVATALPMVVCLVLFGWQVTGQQIHQMSIFGLIIALGLLIDNAIVVTDEVVGRKAQGMPAVKAVGESVRHLFLPLLASTVTTVLAFTPIMLLPGGPGDFVGSIGLSVVLAIVASFAVAMTITAALAGRFGKPRPPGSPRLWWRDGVTLGPIGRAYPQALRWLYARPFTAIALAAALPLAGFAVAPTMGNQFFPQVDRNMFEVRLFLPRDTGIEETTRVASKLETTLRRFDGVEGVSWVVGGSFPTVYYNLVMDQDNAPHYAQAAVTTDTAERTKLLVPRIQAALDAAHPGAQVIVRRFAQGPPVVADIEYRVTGPSTEVLQALGDRLRVALQAHADVLHTQASMPRGEPKLFFAADEDAARLAGLSLTDVARQLAAGIEGSASGEVLEDLERLPVRVRYADADRRSVDAVASTPLAVPGADRWLHASALGDFELRPELGGITRFDRVRTNTISAYVRVGTLPIDTAAEVMASLEADGFELPPGYALATGGSTEQNEDATANLATYVPILVVIMIATLILSFRSLRCAAILGVVALCSVGLALLATWASGFPVSFNMILGTLGLIGVSLNDSIVVLAAIRADPNAASGDRDAVVRAVLGCTRHILATTATTMGGFLPLLVFVGGDFWPSLAIVLVGGIAGASVVALLLIPAAYVLLLGVTPRDRLPGASPSPT